RTVRSLAPMRPAPHARVLSLEPVGAPAASARTVRGMPPRGDRPPAPGGTAMVRPARLACGLALSLLAACGGNKSANATPDANAVEPAIDAPPPSPDALVCTAPEKECTPGMCTDTSSDEQNCGDCGTVCKAGSECKPQPMGCTCVTNFLPAAATGSTIQPIMFGPINLDLAVVPAPGDAG